MKGTCELKPQRISAKRQKLADKVNSSGAEAKRMASRDPKGTCCLQEIRKSDRLFFDDSFFEFFDDCSFSILKITF